MALLFRATRVTVAHVLVSQAACKALNRVVPPRKMDALRLNLVEFSSQLATLNIHYYLTLYHILKQSCQKFSCGLFSTYRN